MAIRPRDVAAILAAAAACTLGASIGYLIVGWIGIGVFGLLTTLVAVQVDLDGAAPIGSAQTTGLFAATRSAEASESRAERAGRLAEAASRRRVLRWAKLFGLIATVVGATGFVLVQLPG